MTWGRGSTRGWRTLRTSILQRDPTCQLHLNGCTIVSTEVDHIRSIATGGTDHPANLRGVCSPCHRRKSLAEAAYARRGKLRRPTEAHPNQRRVV